MKKTSFKLPIKIIIIAITIFLAIFVIISYIWNFLKSSEYFQIKDTVIKGIDAVDLSYLGGKNIFSIDLKSESRYLLGEYPDHGRIKLIRVLPNRIFIDFIKRKPVALLKLYRSFAIDGEGVLFYVKGDPRELNLPVIEGLETKIFGPKPGKKYNLKELSLILNIIKEVEKNRILKDYKIKKIDVANLSNTSIFFLLSQSASVYTNLQPQVTEGILEVKIGQDNIKEKIFVLAGLINQSKKELFNMKYIDLRFKEPVIKLKDVQ